ncbi:MAG: hypothetical protein ABIA21_00205 [Candidatus Aenigmatarchaeota archaeon]
MSIIIVDNGKGAMEIARIIRGSKIVKPTSIPDKENGYILSDGPLDKKTEKTNIDFINKNEKPLLGIGTGAVCLAEAFEAKAKPFSPVKNEKIIMKQRSGLLLDLKKIISVICDTKISIDNLPECFGIIASSTKNPYAMFEYGRNVDVEVDKQLPFYGLIFNPELGLDGLKILKNFEKFVIEVWNKYH